MGVLKFGMKKSKSGKNLGGYQKFGRKKSQKRKKSGGVCNFGMIWKNSAYLPGIFSRPPPGANKKKISTRNKEHEKAVFIEDSEKSALAEHAKSCNHHIKWTDTQTLAVENNFFN